MRPDPLSDVLALIEARCVVSGGFTAGGQWGLRFWPRARLKLVAVVRGSCWIGVDGEPQQIELRSGDVAVVNGQRRVTLGSAADAYAVDMTAAFESSPSSVVRVSEGDTVAVVGGHIEVNEIGEDLLLAALPTITTIRAETAEAGTAAWLLERLLYEMGEPRPGAGAATQGHAQLLLIEVFRAAVADRVAFPSGWLRLITDPDLAPAVRAVHDSPAHPWTLDELAALAMMSRTTFTDRFRSVAGTPPITYVSRWRIRLAQRALRRGATSVARIAADLGYGSESAFSTAFKRVTGRSPSDYRRGTPEGRVAPPLAP